MKCHLLVGMSGTTVSFCVLGSGGSGGNLTSYCFEVLKGHRLGRYVLRKLVQKFDNLLSAGAKKC